MKHNTKKTANHLIHEKSPYLLQHAYNPVDWYPWGDEALSRAKKEMKMIFLSIGYSTCHWCHVMEEESFENHEVAALMNEHFICIKVDREERPDLDKIYMTAVQAMTGSGGWPLNVFLTPDLKPFFGGTYFPAEDKLGRNGMMTLLPKIVHLWKESPREIIQSGEKLTQIIREGTHHQPSAEMTTQLLDQAVNQIVKQFDPIYGGFGRAPKFPQGMTLSFLLRYYHRTSDAKALQMVETTLDEMARGGIYDLLGGGFHRYSTDEKWLVPHFEKMLYDNALLLQNYLEAYQVTGKALYKKISEETIDYILRDLTDPAGGFYSAEDADSEGEEGTFYVWTPEEVTSIIGEERGKIFNQFYDVTKNGNFEEGKSILHQRMELEEFAANQGIAFDELSGIFAQERNALFEARSKRVRPHRDDKILTAWNGLMIASMAYAGQVLNEERYTQAAVKAAHFVLDKLRTDQGLLRRFRDGEARFPAYLDDYAFLVHGLIELYQATFETEWIEKAAEINKEMVELFFDKEAGGFYFSQEKDPTLLTRGKEYYDGAKPSGNSIEVMNLLRLSEFTGNQTLKESAVKILEGISGSLETAPNAYTQSLVALEFLLSSPMEIAVVGTQDLKNTETLLEAVRQPFSPNKVVAFTGKNKAGKEIPISYLKGKIAIGGKPSVYICRNYTCKKPLTEPAEVRSALQGGL